ncbi:MAG: TonB-dependent receptor [Pseudomonadota bacterium]
MTVKNILTRKRLALLGTTALFSHLCAVPVAQAQGEEENGQADVIVVVGSRIERSLEDTTAQPVQFLSEAEFKATPAESVADFLRELPVNNGFSGSNYNNEYAGGNSSINLRGVGPQFTLVLVNGRRFGGESVPDIGAIPPEAVQSVEILKTGGSSIYGSDAVAGVVNIRLKEDFEGLDLVTSYGAATEGGGETFRIAGVGGMTFDRLSVTGSIAYQDYEGFERADRDFTASRDYRPYGGLDRRSGGVGDPNSFFIPSTDEVLTLDTSVVGPGESPTSATQFVPFPGEVNRFSTNEVGVAPPVERINGHWAINYEAIDEVLNFYTEGYFDDRTQDFFAQVPVNFGFPVPASNPFNPFGEDIFAGYVFNELDFITETFETQNFQVAAGVEGTIADINYDISYTRFRQSVDRVYTNDISPGLLTAAAARTDATAFNPFCNNCNTAEQLQGLSLVGRADQRDEIETIDVVFSGDLIDLWAGPLSFAAGYQHRDVSFEVNYNDVWQNGGTNFSWFSEDFVGDSGERDVDAFFGELLTPLYDDGGAGAFVSSVEATVSVRHEEYSDFGDATVFSGLGKVELLDGAVILRGSYSESFRAPSVVALNLPEQTLLESGGFFFDPVRGGFFDVLVITGGNEDLEPENGETISFGVVYTPPQLPGFFASLDYFDLEITDIIRQPSGQGLLDGTETAGSITRDVNLRPTLDTRLNNGGDLSVRGIDFSVSYQFDTDTLGAFTLYANGVYQLENELSANGVTTELLGNFINGAPTPEFRGVFGATWENGAFDAAGNIDYSSSVEEFLDAGSVVIDRETDSWVTVDFQVGYDFSEKFGDSLGLANGLRAYLGVENIFNEGLPFVARSPDGWDRSIGDLRGRYVYGGVRKSF